MKHSTRKEVNPVRKTAWIAGGITLFLILASLSLFTSNVISERNNCQSNTQAVDLQGSWSGLTVQDAPMSAEQAKLATIILETVDANHFDERIAATVMSIAIAESRITNYPWGDATSVGPFQQQEWWGSFDQRRDPVKATTMVLFGGELGSNNYSEPGIVDIAGWKTMDPGELAAEVQKPDILYIDRYSEWMSEAYAIVRAAQSSSSQLENASSVESCNPLDKIVEAALSHVGDTYTWCDETDGACFVSAMFAEAGVSGLPTDIDKLVQYEGDDAAGIRVQWVPASDIGSLQPGDVPVWGRVVTNGESQQGSSEDAGRENVDPAYTGIYVGDLGEGLRVASYNVRGSSHTTGPGQVRGVVRIATAAELITSNGFAVVGLQELQRDQRTELMKILGDGWGIWPAKPVYRDSKRDNRPNSQNSIIWDKSQVKLVEGGWLPMPYYFAGRNIPRDIPLVKLWQPSTDQKFYVANTHDPARPANADLRMLDAKQHARDMDRLAGTGLPVLMTGDFNSGFDLRTRGNTTFRGERENLTWCIMTKSGVMRNGYDAAKRPPRNGCSPITTRELGQGIVDHVYVSDRVTVMDYQVIDRSKTASDHNVVYVEVGFGPIGEKTDQPRPYGSYVGLGEDGVISLLPVQKAQFVGALRFTFVNSAVDSSWNPGSEAIFPLREGTYIDANNYGITGPAWARYHTGDDYFAPCGTTVYAVTSGKVIVDPDKSYGKYFTKIQTEPGGLTTWYAHMESMYVTNGETVSAGDPIGRVGKRGNAFGCHLHFEVHPQGGGYAEDDVDPHEWFAALREQAA